MESYSITANIPIPGNGNYLASYYFNVINNTVVAMYNLNAPGGNILAPSGSAIGQPFNQYSNLADNKFIGLPNSFTTGGINFYDDILKSKLNNNTNIYNFYYGNDSGHKAGNDGNIYIHLWQYKKGINDSDESASLLNTKATVTPYAMSNICFTAGTKIVTNQGKIPIEKIKPNINTIRNKNIVAITQTISFDDYLICFEKNSLGPNLPTKKTLMSKDHKIYYKGDLLEADNFVETHDRVYRTKYNGEILYNVLMDECNKIHVNNLTCETLDPENIIAKLYTANYDKDYENNIIVQMNECILKKDYPTYKKLVKSILKK
jgi:hypothetical protein